MAYRRIKEPTEDGLKEGDKVTVWETGKEYLNREYKGRTGVITRVEYYPSIDGKYIYWIKCYRLNFKFYMPAKALIKLEL